MATGSPSSASEWWAARRSRGQTTPTVALVVVAMVCLGVSLYGTVLDGASPTPDRSLASPTLDRAHDVLAPAGVANPARLQAATDAAPAGYAVNISLQAGGLEWTSGENRPSAGENRPSAGESRPSAKGSRPSTSEVRRSASERRSTTADHASRRVAVRTNATTVEPGRLWVAVWR